MANDGITTPQVVGWTVTGIGIAISLIWNFFNQWKTNDTASKLRAEQYHSGQWARIRGKIDTAVEGLVDAAFDVEKQIHAMDPDKTENAAIQLLNLKIVQAQDKLASSLAEADRSSYCLGSDWAAAANGKLIGYETSWDLVIDAFARAQAATEKAEKLAELGKVTELIRQIGAAVADRCRIQDVELDPVKI